MPNLLNNALGNHSNPKYFSDKHLTKRPTKDIIYDMSTINYPI